MATHPVTQFDPAGSMKRRPFERALLVHRGFSAFVHWAGMTAFTAMIWPRFVAPYRWRLVRMAMGFPGLPAPLAGYRLLQLSDPAHGAH